MCLIFNLIGPGNKAFNIMPRKFVSDLIIALIVVKLISFAPDIPTRYEPSETLTRSPIFSAPVFDPNYIKLNV